MVGVKNNSWELKSTENCNKSVRFTRNIQKRNVSWYQEWYECSIKCINNMKKEIRTYKKYIQKQQYDK